MENGKNELKSTFSTRYVYNSDFVNTNLLDKQYIDRLKSVCTYTSDSVSYSAMVKRKVLYNVQKATNDSVECLSRNPSRTARDSISRVDKIARGKITGQNDSPSNAKTGLCPNMKNVTGQRAPRVNTIQSSAEACKVFDNSIVHSNRFAILGEHIESHVCDSDVEMQTVNRCQKSTRVNDKNGTKMFHKGKNASTDTILRDNPVQRGHNNCFSLGDNLDTVVIPSVEETSMCNLVTVQSGDIRRDNHSRRHSVASNACDTNSNAHGDKYALELNTSLKDMKMKIAKKAEGNALCMQQNVPAFGFIPIYGLGSRVIDRKQGSVCSDILQLHNILRSDGRHNYEGLQIPVASKLHYDVWSKYLTEYWDWQLPLLIKYGFPLDFDRDAHISSEEINHKSATSYPEHVDAYLKEEIDNKAMLGPFETPPIKNLHISPFMTREKSNSDQRRVIMDLSWPSGESVNAGVTPDKYLDVDFILTYPSVDNIVSEVLKLGKGCQIFKVDISRAFRHVPIDPGDLDLLGLHWGDYFLDFSLPFGFKHGSLIFQRLSDAIRFIMAQEKHHIWNYIDDFLCVSTPSKIQASYVRLQELLAELGLTVSPKKLVPPDTRVVCLGIVVDTVQQSISIPSEKLDIIKLTCAQWSSKVTCSKRELQSLLGSLLYIAKCVKYARCFLNRMLTLLRKNFDKKTIVITEEFKQDLKWFNTFLPVYNGVTFFKYVPSKLVHLDACPTGLGAIYDQQVYAMDLPHGWSSKNIAHLEMINILVSIKVWHTQWANQSVLIKCDNQAVVSVLATGRARDQTMATYARNIFMWLSAFNIDVRVVHVAGKLNPVADLLSRWQSTVNNHEKLAQLVPSVTWIPVSKDLLYVDQLI